MEWRNVSFTVPDREKKGSMRKILQPMSGEAKGGRMLAIMGSSGAGKTSFLNILSGRTQAKDRDYVKGDLLLNSQRMTPNNMQSHVAFVQQEDHLMKTDTPQEAIQFSANLRLPTTMPQNCRDEWVKLALDKLGLDKCRNTRIGDANLKGISGGEKRRVSIGVECISNPPIIFLDEPTSGLDFVTALSVIQSMQTLARTGKVVIATIHQPASEIFHLFDDLLLLSQGKIAYHGPVEGASAHFKKCGYPCPEHYNPADHYLAVLEGTEATNKLTSAFSDKLKENGSVVKPTVKKPVDLLPTTRHTPGMFTQMANILKREFRAYYRDPKTTIANFVVTIIMALFLGFINQNAAAKDNNWQEANGALFLLVIQSMFFGIFQVILQAVGARSVFDREHIVGTYSIFPYMMSVWLAAVPIMLLRTGLFLLILHLFIGFQSSFLMMWIVVFIMSQVGVGWGLFVGFTTGDVQVASALMSLLITPQMYVAGFYRPTDNMPGGIRWLSYISGSMYAFKSMLILEFGDHQNHFAHPPEGLGGETAEARFRNQFFKQNRIDPVKPETDQLFYMLMPIALWGGLMTFAMLALKLSAMRR